MSHFLGWGTGRRQGGRVCWGGVGGRLVGGRGVLGEVGGGGGQGGGVGQAGLDIL